MASPVTVNSYARAGAVTDTAASVATAATIKAAFFICRFLFRSPPGDGSRWPDKRCVRWFPPDGENLRKRARKFCARGHVAGTGSAEPEGPNNEADGTWNKTE